MHAAFDVPRGITAEELAQTFTAYLLGSLASHNAESQYGPYRMRPGDDENWQLDSSNNYWLHIIDPSKADLTCCYDGQKRVIEAAVALFKARFDRP
jgi:hypothetical protein